MLKRVEKNEIRLLENGFTNSGKCEEQNIK